MKAIRVYEFGGPEVLKLEEMATPTPSWLPVAPEACEAHCGAEFPRFCERTRSSALRAGDNQRGRCWPSAGLPSTAGDAV
jgi:hypothetical protein